MRRVHTTIASGQWLDGTPYRVVRVLGEGGMGEIYEVDHIATGTRRALKVVHRQMLRADPMCLRRFVREARVLQGIDHPNIVTVYDAGVLRDGRPYYTMELLHGVSFRALNDTYRTLLPRAVVPLVVQALIGLEVIHRRGIVHRDIKPANLFYCYDGVVKVLDLGIAKLLDPQLTGPNTCDGVVIGTQKYMSPEQRWSAYVDQRSDLYSMGLVLMELLLGRSKFTVQAVMDGTLGRMCNERLPGIRQVLARALAYDYHLRYASARDFATHLFSLWPCTLARRRKMIPIPTSSLHWEFTNVRYTSNKWLPCQCSS